MKRFIIFFMIPIAICIGLCACAPGQNGAGEGLQSTEVISMYVYINDNRLEVELEDNGSVEALVALLKDDDIIYTADDYGGFEKVGYIGHTLPRNDTQITVEAGDIVLYQGNNICIFYNSTAWSYTRLGRIKGYSADRLQDLLGAGCGQVQVTLSLN